MRSGENAWRILQGAMAGWAFACLMYPAPAPAADPWKGPDIALGAAAAVLTAADWAQTRYIARNPDQFYETNPLLGEHPSVGRVDKHFAGVMVGGAIIAHFLPQNVRRGFLGGVAIVELHFVEKNASLGIRMRF